MLALTCKIEQDTALNIPFSNQFIGLLIIASYRAFLWPLSLLLKYVISAIPQHARWLFLAVSKADATVHKQSGSPWRIDANAQ